MTAALATTAAFVRRDWAIVRSYRVAYALDVIAIFFTLALVFYVARLVDGSKLSAKAGINRDYFAFAVVGVALVRMVQTGLSSFANRLREEQTTGTFETLMAAPTSPSLVVLASGAYGLLRAAISGALTIIVAIALFGLRFQTSAASVAVAAAALLACLLMFAAVGVTVAAFTIVFKQTTSALGFVTAGLAMLGGAYFPVGLLPGPLHAIASALPFTWGLDVLRQSVLGGDPDLTKLGLLAVFDAAALPAALLVFRAALRHSRQKGTLGHY